MGIFIVLCIIFLCTTMDSSTIAVTEMTTHHDKGKTYPAFIPHNLGLHRMFPDIHPFKYRRI